MTDVEKLPWYEREKLFTRRDKEAIERARRSSWEEIDLSWAETEAGRLEVEEIMRRGRFRDEEGW